MIQALEIKLAAPAAVKLPQSACSLLHGVLMEQIDSAYADFLHQNALRPYSQYLHFEKEKNAGTCLCAAADGAFEAKKYRAAACE